MSSSNLFAVLVVVFILGLGLGWNLGSKNKEAEMKAKTEQLARDRVAAMEQHRIWTERMDAYYND